MRNKDVLKKLKNLPDNTEEYINNQHYWEYPEILYDNETYPKGYVDVTTLKPDIIYKTPKYPEVELGSLSKIVLCCKNDDGTLLKLDDSSNMVGLFHKDDPSVFIVMKAETAILMRYISNTRDYYFNLNKNDNGIWEIKKLIACKPFPGNEYEYVPTTDYDPSTKKYVDDKVAGLVNSAPETLDTLNELANALGNDANFATTVTNSLANKADSNHTHEEYLTDQDLSEYAPLNSPSFTNSISMGRKSGTTIGTNSVALGYSATASGDYSHAEGYLNVASGDTSHAEGTLNKASGDNSHVEGGGSSATGSYSHAEGHISVASGIASHAEGEETEASGENSHAEGSYTNSIGDYSHAEGRGSEALGNVSHAEGLETFTSGIASHVEGHKTVASGDYSHAEGEWTISSSISQHVQGKYNIEDVEGKYAHIVGNGTDNNTRSNAYTLDWEGNGWYKNEVYVGGTSKDNANKLLSTKDITFNTDGQLEITINNETKKFIDTTSLLATDEEVDTMLNEVLGGDYSGN